MTTAGRLITADELMMMPEDGKRYELVRGTLVEKMPTGHPHAKVASKFDRALGNYTENAGNYGEVVVGAGYFNCHGSWNPRRFRAANGFQA